MAAAHLLHSDPRPAPPHLPTNRLNMSLDNMQPPTFNTPPSLPSNPAPCPVSALARPTPLPLHQPAHVTATPTGFSSPPSQAIQHPHAPQPIPSPSPTPSHAPAPAPPHPPAPHLTPSFFAPSYNSPPTPMSSSLPHFSPASDPRLHPTPSHVPQHVPQPQQPHPPHPTHPTQPPQPSQQPPPAPPASQRFAPPLQQNPDPFPDHVLLSDSYHGLATTQQSTPQHHQLQPPHPLQSPPPTQLHPPQAQPPPQPQPQRQPQQQQPPTRLVHSPAAPSLQEQQPIPQQHTASPTPHLSSSSSRREQSAFFDPPSLSTLPNEQLLVHPSTHSVNVRFPPEPIHTNFSNAPSANITTSHTSRQTAPSLLPLVSGHKPPKQPGHTPYAELSLSPIEEPGQHASFVTPNVYFSDAQPIQPPIQPQQNVLPHLSAHTIPSIRSLPGPSHQTHPQPATAYLSPLPPADPSYATVSGASPILSSPPQPVYPPHTVVTPPVQEPSFGTASVLSNPTAVQPLINSVPAPAAAAVAASAYASPLVSSVFPPSVDHSLTPSATPGPGVTLQPILAQHQLPSHPAITVPEFVSPAQFSVSVDMLESFMAVGRMCRSIGRYDLAADAFRACISICPESNEARVSYASACWNGVDINRPDFSHSVDVSPVFAEDVFNNIGNSLRGLGRQSEAELAYRAALNISPRHAHAWNNLGNALRARGAFIDAMSCYSASLTHQPGFAAAHCNLAGLLRDQGKPQEAEAQYRAALLSDPNLAEAAAGLGTALRDMGRTEEAVTFYVRAVNLQPDAADHHANLANTYKDLNRIEESIVNYQAALSLQPDMPDAFCNMVHSLSVICDWHNRSQNFVTLLAIVDRQLDTLLRHPNTTPRLYSTLVGALSNSTPQLVDACGGSRSDRDNASVSTNGKEENSNDVARRKYVHHPSSPTVVRKAKRKAKFSQFMTNTSSVVAPVLASGLPSVQPFHALIYPMSPEKFKALSAAYASRAESMVQGLPHVTQRWTSPHGARARLKVGYVSSDYNNHPYSHLTQSVYGLHGTGTTVECFCYALTPSDQSAWRLRIERESENFRDISGLTAKQSAEAIASDGIHVLVNCNGYTKGARTELFALRPAPIQVSFMGFPGTLGAHYIEYFITDVVTSPPHLANRMHSEALLYHPHSYFVNDHKQTSVPGPRAHPSGPLTRAHYGLPEDCFLFIMHNQLYKLSPDTFDVWARILKRVPNSKIWLLRFPPSGEQRIRQEALARGLGPDRLIFTDVAGKDEHVARAGLGDLFLDTPTCNAHTTGTDVLWSGCPMITCPGSLFASRVAASLLTAAGVPELVAHDMNEYEDLAVELATNRAKLAQIRGRIESSRYHNALFDTERWVRNVEALYWRAWKNFEDGKEPQHIYGQDVYDGSTMVSRGVDGSGGAVAVGTSGTGMGFGVENVTHGTQSGDGGSWHSESPLHGRVYSSTVMT